MSPGQLSKQAAGELVRTEFDELAHERGLPVTKRVVGWAFVPHPLPPPLTLSQLPEPIFYEILAAERSLARLDGVGEDLPNARLLWAPLAKREAILSSAIEDTIATALELASLEAGQKPERKEAVEVMNYVDALRFGLESELPICTRLIRGMHEKLMAKGVRGSEWVPGEIRTTQNYIGNVAAGFARARFVPPPPGEPLNSGLASLESYANRKSLGLPKSVAIALMHYQFEALHPFPDGNGRIGRLLSALSLCRMDLIRQPLVYLSGYFEPRQSEYNDLMLRVSTHGEWVPWIRFFVQALAYQARDAENRVRTLRELRATYRSKLSRQNHPGRMHAIIDDLFIHPAVTVEMVAGKLEVSRPTARSYIKRLQAIGVLTPMDREYRAVWIAKEILQFIDAPPSSPQPISE